MIASGGEEPQTRHFFICCCYFGLGRLARLGEAGGGELEVEEEGGGRNSCHVPRAGGLEGKGQLATLREETAEVETTGSSGVRNVTTLLQGTTESRWT